MSRRRPVFSFGANGEEGEGQAQIPGPGGNPLSGAIIGLAGQVNQAINVIARRNNAIERMEGKIRKLQGQIQARGEELNTLQTQHESVQGQLAAAEQKRQAAEEAVQKAEEEGKAGVAAAQKVAAEEAAQKEAELQVQQQKLQEQATAAKSAGESAATQIAELQRKYAALETQVKEATVDLNRLTTKLGAALESVPDAFKGGATTNAQYEQYMAELMNEAAEQTSAQFGFTNKFKFGSCGKKMHGKKRRK